MSNTSFANDEWSSHIRKSQIEMYKEKRRRAFLSTSSTRINAYNRYSYMEYENQVCTAAECYQPVPWKRGRRVYSFMQRWCTNWGRIDHNSFSICFWPKQWHFFLQVVASPFQLRSVSFFLVELGWVCLSFFQTLSSRCFHWMLRSVITMS